MQLQMSSHTTKKHNRTSSLPTNHTFNLYLKTESQTSTQPLIQQTNWHHPNFELDGTQDDISHNNTVKKLYAMCSKQRYHRHKTNPRKYCWRSSDPFLSNNHFNIAVQEIAISSRWKLLWIITNLIISYTCAKWFHLSPAKPRSSSIQGQKESTRTLHNPPSIPEPLENHCSIFVWDFYGVILSSAQAVEDGSHCSPQIWYLPS